MYVYLVSRQRYPETASFPARRKNKKQKAWGRTKLRRRPARRVSTGEIRSRFHTGRAPPPSLFRHRTGEAEASSAATSSGVGVIVVADEIIIAVSVPIALRIVVFVFGVMPQRERGERGELDGPPRPWPLRAARECREELITPTHAESQAERREVRCEAHEIQDGVQGGRYRGGPGERGAGMEVEEHYLRPFRPLGDGLRA